MQADIKEIRAQEFGDNHELWQRFAEAATQKAFWESWLSLQCRMLADVKGALLLLGTPDSGPFTPAAVFPDASYSVTHLAGTAERAIKERRGLAVVYEPPQGTGSPKTCHIAYPIEVSGKLQGAVILETGGVSADQVQKAMRLLHWGVAWVEVMVLRAEASMSQEANERLRKVLDSVAGVVEHERFQPAAMGFITGLASTLECDRVSIGFVGRKDVRVVAVSHTAEFGKKTNLIRAIESAMEEALDQQAVIVHPLPDGAASVVSRAQDDLARKHDMGAVLTASFGQGTTPYGAITLERQKDKPFDETTIEIVKTVAALAGPILETKRKEDLLITTKVAEACVTQLRSLVGPGHFGIKLAALAAVVIIVFFTFARGTHRVTAKTILEGIVQRAVGAPFNGYVVEAPARSGDVVREGDVLCRLDDRDLKLERLKWATQKDQFLKQYSEAMAKHDRAQALINGAKIDEAEAQISLYDEQLSRAVINAPFDGVVTIGDFSQLLGTPVERGQVLFEVAPLRGYRVIVQVDERDIGWVGIGQRGDLVLPSVPGAVFPLTVTRITPISTAEEGRNYFRVEAELIETSERLRPGMEGIGKIVSGRARLIWIWTHTVTEWVRLKLWSWWP